MDSALQTERQWRRSWSIDQAHRYVQAYSALTYTWTLKFKELMLKGYTVHYVLR